MFSFLLKSNEFNAFNMFVWDIESKRDREETERKKYRQRDRIRNRVTKQETKRQERKER